MTDNGLLLLLSATRPKTKGILTECIVMTCVSKALTLELDCDTFSNTLQITSPDNCPFLLNLIPMGYHFASSDFE